METKRLIQDGYRPVNLVILHDAGVVVQPADYREETPWWKGYSTTGKSVSIEGQSLVDLAAMFGIKTHQLKRKGVNDRTHYQDPSYMDIPLFSIDIQEQGKGEDQAESLFAKEEGSTLHLAAFFQDEEPKYSSHRGSYDVFWKSHKNEVVP